MPTRGWAWFYADSRATLIAAGLAYSVGPHTELCGLLARIGNGANSANNFGANRATLATGTRLLAAGIGLVQRF